MERLRNLWNSKYFRATIIGAITFIAARIVLIFLPDLMGVDELPIPTVLALIPAGWAGYLILKHYRYY